MMMEKKHLIHHIWSQRGYELYTVILLTQTSFNFYCLAEEEQAEFNSGSRIAAILAKSQPHNFYYWEDVRGKRHSWIFRSQTEFCCAGSLTNQLLICM